MDELGYPYSDFSIQHDKRMITMSSDEIKLTSLIENFDDWYQFTSLKYYRYFAIEFIQKTFNNVFFDYNTIFVRDDDMTPFFEYMNSITTKIIKKRFIIVYLGITYSHQPGGHVNAIVIDQKLKIIEKFEPHGVVDLLSTYDLIKDSLLETNLSYYGYTYYSQISNCPFPSIQVIADDKYGLCQTFVVYYFTQRLYNTKKDIINIQQDIYDRFNEIPQKSRIHVIKDLAARILQEALLTISARFRGILLNFNFHQKFQTALYKELVKELHNTSDDKLLHV